MYNMQRKFLPGADDLVCLHNFILFLLSDAVVGRGDQNPWREADRTAEASTRQTDGLFQRAEEEGGEAVWCDNFGKLILLSGVWPWSNTNLLFQLVNEFVLSGLWQVCLFAASLPHRKETKQVGLCRVALYHVFHAETPFCHIRGIFCGVYILHIIWQHFLQARFRRVSNHLLHMT